VITDINMPGMSGVQFTEKLREVNRDIPIYYLSSGKNEDQFLKDQKKYNLAGMIKKPFKRQDIVDLLGAQG